ncbi:hypothetical protein ATANTOWER_029062, partial [Ataeniobius toweri]|nr:hypothetical protein [Ataeniobius toweri]
MPLSRKVSQCYGDQVPQSAGQLTKLSKQSEVTWLYQLVALVFTVSSCQFKQVLQTRAEETRCGKEESHHRQPL